MLISGCITGATGVGLATIADNGAVLETWFPVPHLRSDVASSQTVRLPAEEAAAELGNRCTQAVRHDARRAASIVAVRTHIADLAEPPIDVHDVYLRLQLLSHRLIKPREANLEGMLAILPDVAWTSIGSCLPQQVEAARWMGRAQGFEVDVRSVLRVPRMVDYVVPKDVSIGNCDRVMLGAHLASGTMVTPAGFCSFNAGTLGPAMVEGRISAGVVVGEGSDIGGGASIMGTLSGGGKEVITVGRNCLLGANSGIGISLGDNCVVEAGCYVTAGVPVTLSTGEVVKAVALSGRANMLFRRNSRTGKIEAIQSTKGWGSLNPVLHKVSSSPSLSEDGRPPSLTTRRCSRSTSSD